MLISDDSKLTYGSHKKVEVKCDFCGKIYTKEYRDYIKQHDGGDCCKDCLQKKAHMKLQEKYGENYMDNLNNGFKEKYHVDNPMQITEFKDKLFETQIEKYGAIGGALTLEENKGKGGKKSQEEEARAKRKETNKAKYGCECHLSNHEIRAKIMDSYYKNGSVKTSKQQFEIYKMLKEHYKCFLNYPEGIYFLDCMIEINGIKIDVEYDGEYWHNLRAKEDEKRDKYMLNNNYKILRILGSHSIPSIDALLENIEVLISTKTEFITLYCE